MSVDAIAKQKLINLNILRMDKVEVNKQAKLSEHFTLGELTVTSVKTADGRSAQGDALLAFSFAVGN